LCANEKVIWKLRLRRLVARIEEISYFLSKHKEDKIGEVNSYKKTTRELGDGRLHSRRRREADC
jgi:hypothetical protein